MKTQFKFYSDAGHAWVAVKKSLLVELGIDKKISNFSYMKGQTAYLEEDCDAYRFHQAMEARGTKPEYVEVDHGMRSPIRNYPRFDAQY